MAIADDASEGPEFMQDRLSGAARANVIDRWIYVFTAALFVAIALAGFVPDSLAKMADVQAGRRPPFPLILHVHAALMGGFLLLLLAQSVLAALNRRNWHMRLGMAAAVLFPALVVANLVLVPTMYHAVRDAAQTAPEPIRHQLQGVLPVFHDILLFQIREGVLFVILMWIALRSRMHNPGIHKRLIFLAAAPLLAAAFDRIQWLPQTMPDSPLGSDLYTLLAVAPMLIWDLTRNRRLHPAYLIWAALYMPLTAAVYVAWNTPWWQATAPRLLGV